jgi:hypothetical protein
MSGVIVIFLPRSLWHDFHSHDACVIHLSLWLIVLNTLALSHLERAYRLPLQLRPTVIGHSRVSCIPGNHPQKMSRHNSHITMMRRHAPHQRRPVWTLPNRVWTALPIFAILVSAYILQRQYINDEFSKRVVNTLTVETVHSRDLHQRFVIPWIRVATMYLKIWQASAVFASQDMLRAMHSSGALMYWTLRPMVMFGSLFARWSMIAAYVLMYEWILVRGLFSPAAIQHMKNLTAKAVQWQLARTPRQVALEILVLVSTVALYKLVKFLQRRRYLQSIQGWIRRRHYMMARVSFLHRDGVDVMSIQLLSLFREMQRPRRFVLKGFLGVGCVPINVIRHVALLTRCPSPLVSCAIRLFHPNYRYYYCCNWWWLDCPCHCNWRPQTCGCASFVSLVGLASVLY